MKLTEEQYSLLWLSSAEVAADRVSLLTEQYGNAAEIRKAFLRNEKLPFARKEKEKLSALQSTQALEDYSGLLESHKIRILFRDDPLYPEQLAHIQDPPYVLYYAGKLSAMQKPCIGVIGTRKPSKYGREMAAEIACGLAKAGVTVVSGLAYGIDEAAHRASLDANGTTVGVMGSGLNVPYPMDHLELMREIAGRKGLVLSEYPLNAEAKSFHFPYRNRVISGLSFGIVFVEGKIQSGGMHTVTSALSQGREVFAVPGQVGTVGAEGPNAVLRDGGRIITSAKDLLEDIGLWEETPASEPEREETEETLSPLQKQIVGQLSRETMGTGEIASALSLPEEEISSEIGIMEILGIVERESGNRFRLPLSRHRRKS